MPLPMDIDALIQCARRERRSVCLEEAQDVLGSALRECDLTGETLQFRRQGTDILLPPTTWIRVLRRIQDQQAHG